MNNNNQNRITHNSTLSSLRQTYSYYEEQEKKLRQIANAERKEQTALQSQNNLYIAYINWLNSVTIPDEIALMMHPNNIVTLFCFYNGNITPLGNKQRLSSPALLLEYISDLFFQTTSRNFPDSKCLNSNFTGLFNALYEYLKKHPLPPYWNFLQSYVKHTYVHSFLFDASNFISINGNIYLYHKKQYITFQHDFSLLNNDFIEKLYPADTKRLPNNFYKKFYKQISKVLFSDNIYSYKSTVYSPYSFHIEINKNIYEAQLLSNEMTIIPKPFPYNFHASNIIKKQNITKLSLPMSETSIQLLNLLASGNVEQLKELSCFYSLLTTAHYHSLKKSERKIQIISGSAERINAFISFLSKCNISSPLIDGLNNVTKKNNLVNISTYPFQGINYVSFLPSKKKETSRQQDIIISLLKGNKFQCNNSIGFPTIIKNQLPLVCFSDSSLQTERIANTYPSQIINLDFEVDNVSAILTCITEEDICVIKYFLALYGLYTLSSIKKSRKKAVNSVNQDSVMSFISSFCYTENNKYTYFEELYITYSEFCCKSGITPLSYICFNKRLKQSYEYKRPHTTRSDNRWAYCNLAFNRTAYDEYINTPLEAKNNIQNNLKETILHAQEQISFAIKNSLDNFNTTIIFDDSTIYFNLVDYNQGNHSD